MTYSAQLVRKIWKSGEQSRNKLLKYRRYYEGTNSIVQLTERKIDGRTNSVIRTNWTKYVVEAHATFLTSKDIRFSLRNFDAGIDGLTRYKDIAEYNNLDSLDTINLINCLLYGYAVNVHSFDGEKYPITVDTDPLDWVFVKDDQGKIVSAVYHVLLPEFSIYNGELLEKDVELLYSYEIDATRVYKISKDGLILTEVIENQIGRLPFTVYYVSQNWKPFLSLSFLSASDGYTVINSSMVDSIRYDVESLWVASGMKIQDFLARDENGKSNYDKLKENGVIVLPPNGKFEAVERNISTEKVTSTMDSLRETVHIEGSIPDLLGAVSSGQLTNISGIALKLLFSPQLQKALEFAKYYEDGIRDRVDYYNLINSLTDYATLENYDIKFDISLPSNQTEILQYLGNLNGIVSKKDQLELLEFITSPELAYSNLLAEQNNGTSKVEQSESQTNMDNLNQ